MTLTPVAPTARPALVRRAMGMVFTGPDDEALTEAVRGRTVLITGASSGIGEAAARRLGHAGAHVVLVARRVEELERVAGDVRALGGTASTYPADLSDPAAIEALLGRLLADHPAIDVVVNNAGRSIRRPVGEAYDRFHDYQRTMAVNYFGPVRLLLGLLPGMRARGEGHIVNVGTIGVDAPQPYWSAYVASKAAFETWLTTVSPEARADGVTSTSIHFGLVHTAMSAPNYAQAQGGMSAREAGDVVCRAIVDRPRMIRPWWSWLGALGGAFSPAIADRIMTATVRWDVRRGKRRRGLG